MDKQQKARQRECRSSVRMMIAARHEAEHGRYKKALRMIHKAWTQGMRANQNNTDNVIHEIYSGSTELMWELKEALVAYSKAVRRERRFLKWRKKQMKKRTIIKMAAAGTLAAMLIGGAAVTASAANGGLPVKPVKPMPIRVIEAPSIGLSNRVPLLKQMQEKLKEYCKESNVPYYMALAVIDTISGFDNSYHGDSGQGERVGYMGVPLTAEQMFENLRGLDLRDPYDNMKAGCYLLGWLKERHESWEETLLCYDVGEGNAARYFLPWGKTTKFVKDALVAARKWRLIIS